MQLSVITPDHEIFSEEIDQVTIPTTAGEITVLPHHISLVSQIEPGELAIKHNGKLTHLAVAGGYVTVDKDTVSIVADYAVKSEDIVYEKAIEAQKRAEEAMKKAQEASSDIDYAAAEKAFLRSLLETKVAVKRRHRT